MTVFEEIRRETMADSMNQAYTERGLLLFSASADAAWLWWAGSWAQSRRGTPVLERSQRRSPAGMAGRYSAAVLRRSTSQLPMDFTIQAEADLVTTAAGFAEKWHPRLLAAMPRVKP